MGHSNLCFSHGTQTIEQSLSLSHTFLGRDMRGFPNNSSLRPASFSIQYGSGAMR
jgi:hypothetical protein